MSVLHSVRREHLLKELAALLDQEFFKAWCPTLDIREPSPNVFEISCPTRYLRELVEPTLRPALAQALRALTGTTPTVGFRIEGEAPAEPERAPEPAARAPRPTVLGVPLQEGYTFDTFIEGPPNRFAKAAGLQVAQDPFQHPLFIHGKSGVGKTHLLHAICHQALALRPKLKIAYLPCEAFISEFVSALKSNSAEEFRRRYTNADFLVVDDVDMLADKDATQNEFFHLFNHLHLHRRQMVFSSDSPPRGIQTFKERLFSRLESGLVAELEPPNLEMRAAIVAAKAEKKGRPFDPQIARFIAETITDNVRELEGAVVKVIALASLTGGPLDLELAREALRRKTHPPRRPATIEEICRIVGARYGVEPRELLGRSRSPRITRAKQVALTVCRLALRYTFRELARAFGASAHNSVAYAVRKTEEAAQRDPALRRDLDELLRQAEQLMKMFPQAG